MPCSVAFLHNESKLVQHPFGPPVASPRGRTPDADGGDEGIRTPDPLLAKQVLFQLSYAPIRCAASKRSRMPMSYRCWWVVVDSNHRPLPYQGNALTS
jgi:hypothetical protein